MKSKRNFFIILLSLIFILMFNLVSGDITTGKTNYFNLDNITNVNDLITNLNGTNTGATLSTGIKNNSFVFTSNTYVALPIGNSVLTDNTDFSYSVWVNPTSCNVGGTCSIVGGVETSNYGMLSGISLGKFGIYTTTNGWVEPTTIINNNQWLNIIVTFESASNDLKIYFNGTNVYQNLNYLDWFESGQYMKLGNAYNIDLHLYNMRGKIDEFIVYNRDLSSSDVLELYNSYFPSPINYSIQINNFTLLNFNKYVLNQTLFINTTNTSFCNFNLNNNGVLNCSSVNNINHYCYVNNSIIGNNSLLFNCSHINSSINFAYNSTSYFIYDSIKINNLTRNTDDYNLNQNYSLKTNINANCLISKDNINFISCSNVLNLNHTCLISNLNLGYNTIYFKCINSIDSNNIIYYNETLNILFDEESENDIKYLPKYLRIIFLILFMLFILFVLTYLVSKDNNVIILFSFLCVSFILTIKIFNLINIEFGYNLNLLIPFVLFIISYAFYRANEKI